MASTANKRWTHPLCAVFFQQVKIDWNKGRDAERTQGFAKALEGAKPVLKEGAVIASDGCGLIHNVMAKVAPRNKHIAFYRKRCMRLPHPRA